MKKLAIVIRGSVGAGKSTAITGLIGLYHPHATSVSLDEGWAAGEIRYSGGDTRYADLISTSPVLLIELAYGEPQEEGFGGASKNPEEWSEVLRNDERDIHLIRLTADWDTTMSHLRERGSDADSQKGWYEKYDLKEWNELPAKIGLTEHVINTRDVDRPGVVALIAKTVGSIE